VQKKTEDPEVEEMLIAMQGKLIQQHMHVEDLNITVTAFKPERTDADGDIDSGALRVNFYCAKINENTDVMVTREDQIDIIGR